MAWAIVERQRVVVHDSVLTDDMPRVTLWNRLLHGSKPNRSWDKFHREENLKRIESLTSRMRPRIVSEVFDSRDMCCLVFEERDRRGNRIYFNYGDIIEPEGYVHEHWEIFPEKKVATVYYTYAVEEVENGVVKNAKAE